MRYENFTGKVGESDLAGTLQVDTGGKRPRHARATCNPRCSTSPTSARWSAPTSRSEDGVLPDTPFDPARWDSVDADVRIKAGTIKRPEQLPLENLSARIQMKDQRADADPLEFGIAGGKFAGTGNARRPQGADPGGPATCACRSCSSAQLFPTIKRRKASVGDIGGLVELKGTGDSVAQMLGQLERQDRRSSWTAARSASS